ncbi:unnamed protein product [Blepharisma stoltei]|uniref:PX domain-containing protein n=1 Tax=Blepharisma stoltei TaxID=1481888 RepID=A0AAU9ISM8_9CILI|nr:unnamed protein product [Blepharisma stoltei]
MEFKFLSIREASDKSDKHFIYQFEVKYKDWQVVLEKRYSEFLELHRVMKLIRISINQPLPHFPGQMLFKTLFRKVSSEDIEERKVGLESYMNELSKGICAKNSKYFPDFISLPARLRDEYMQDI